jgi:hypothetical protein
LVVDVTLTLADGRTVSSSTPFELRRAGAVQEAKPEPTEKDQKGHPVILMPSTPR